jgi:hypothetical protein
MSELFSFADEEQWPDSRMHNRMMALTRSQEIPHSEGRREQVARELSHIIFEGRARRGEFIVPENFEAA